MTLSASQGPDALLGALATAIEWKDANIARGAMAILPTVWDGRQIDPRSPLIEALGVSDKTVRFAAAVALLKINPDRPFPGSGQVVPLAAQAVDIVGNATTDQAARDRVVLELPVEPITEIPYPDLLDLDEGQTEDRPGEGQDRFPEAERQRNAGPQIGEKPEAHQLRTLFHKCRHERACLTFWSRAGYLCA